MDSVAVLPDRDRGDLFRAAAATKGVSPQIIEKDFWVCWVLHHLAALSEVDASLCFKGGTSLSKVFGVIERMSEDIDLVIDREALGFVGDNDPSSRDLGTKARERLINELKAAAGSFVEGRLFPSLHARIADALGPGDGWSLEADVSNLDNTTIAFHYPAAEQRSPYLKPMVLLELGARGDTWPAIQGSVTPYAAEIFPDQFKVPKHAIPTITAERTFWEKATYLHALAHQAPEKAAGAKPARHYYDILQLSRHELGRKAIRDTVLLADVVKHKTTFYRQSSARYELAVPGTLRLVPDEPTAKLIRSDYDQMIEEMVFGDAPDFTETLDALAEIEAAINGAP